MLQATLLCVVVATGRETPALMFGLACLLGLCNAFDIPTRQAFLTDLAGEDLPNAIAFNSALVNGARLVGPAVGGWVVATLGEQWCFGLNALSFLAVLGALLAQEDVQGQGRQRRAPGALQEGLRYAWETPHVRRLLALVAVTSLTATSYTVLMPAFARDVFHGDASTQGHLLGAGGLGAFLGAALLLRREGTLGLEVRVAWGSTLFALGLLLLSRAQTEWQACLVLIPVGLGFMSQMASTNTLLQAHAPPALRGRVMGLFSTLFVGVQPLGALVLGHLARAWGPQAAVGLGASCLLVASLWFHRHRPALPVPAGG
jgi:MFS family permease